MDLARSLLPSLGLASLLALGCTAEVTTLDPTRGACVAAVPAPAALLDVTDVKSAAFVGDALHLQAKAGGVDRYLVVRFAADARAYAVAAPDELLGPANLVPLGAGRHARVRVDAAGAAHVDVLDTSIPAAPALIADLSLAVVVDPPDVFSAAGGHMFFCARPAAGAQQQLTAVDLSDPTAPAAPQSMDGFACYLEPEGKFAAQGSTWIAWNLPTGSFAQETNVFAVTPTGEVPVVDLGYNQTGVHQYGNVLRAATDGARAVFDTENASLFLLADATSGPNGAFTWATFAVEKSRSLVGVASAIAYLQTPSGMRAYDIADITSPKLLPFHAKVAFEGEARLLTSSDEHLVVVDGGGTLYLVTRDDPGTVAPLQVYEGPAPAEPLGCAR